MRTTIDLDEDLLRLAKHLASEQGESLGRVLSALVRRGLEAPSKTKARAGVIPTLPRKPGAQPVTGQMVKDLLEREP